MGFTVKVCSNLYSYSVWHAVC